MKILRRNLASDKLLITDSIRYIIEGAIKDYELMVGKKIDDIMRDQSEDD